AMIDQGKLIAQGPIAEILCGAKTELVIGCDDPVLALQVLSGASVVSHAERFNGGVKLQLSEPDAAAAINARLVGAGVGVFRLEPVRESLEQHFLSMTTRVGGEGS